MMMDVAKKVHITFFFLLLKVQGSPFGKGNWQKVEFGWALLKATSKLFFTENDFYSF